MYRTSAGIFVMDEMDDWWVGSGGERQVKNIAFATIQTLTKQLKTQQAQIEAQVKKIETLEAVLKNR